MLGSLGQHMYQQGEEKMFKLLLWAFCYLAFTWLNSIYTFFLVYHTLYYLWHHLIQDSDSLVNYFCFASSERRFSPEQH